MKDLRDILEGLLAGQDSVMATGDKYIELMKQIKHEFNEINKLTPKKFNNSVDYLWKCPAFLEYCGLDNCNYIRFSIEYWEGDDDDVTIECEMKIFNNDLTVFSNNIDFVTVVKTFKNRTSAFNALIKNIKNVFNIVNIDSLKKRIMEKVKITAI